MTANEAMDRAARIWGADRVLSVHVREDGGADIHTRFNTISVRLDHAVSARHFAYHRLDRHGHVACHHDCATLEP